MSEYGYIPEAPEQSFGNNKGIFTPKDIYDLTRADKYTNYGQLELIETQTFSSTVSVIDFDDIKQDTYNVHFMTFNNMKTAGDNQETICLRFMVGGVVQTSSDYIRAMQRFSSSSSLFGESRTTDSKVAFVYGTGNATGEGTSGYAYFYDLGDSSKYSFVTGQVTSLTNGAIYAGAFGSSVYDVTNVVNGIQVLKNSGNYSAFDVSLYGIRYS
jgi:hypothetical protein